MPEQKLHAVDPTSSTFDPISIIAREEALPQEGVLAVVQLIAAGSTVPFIARYRKEATGSLDEVQIRAIAERHTYLNELEERRQTILQTIQEQGKLTPALQQQIRTCTTKAALEDLYLPFKPKRRTRATVAKEKGLEPLAEHILQQPADGDPESAAAPFVDAEKGVADALEALAGARHIIAERVAEDADMRAFARDAFHKHGEVVATPVPEKTQEPSKYEQYYDYREAVPTIPSHRFLAVRRGEREGVLRVHIELPAERLLPTLQEHFGLRPQSPFAQQLEQAIADAYERLLAPSIETDIRVALKQRADGDAVNVFANNLRNLLLAAPLGQKAVVGIDPGLRTGCKCVAIAPTGTFLAHITIYLTQDKKRAQQELLALLQRVEPGAIAVGNGTGGREAQAFVRQTLADAELSHLPVVSVNESGASVYSASDIARDEFPDLDLTIRGAISIGRRLQDPLAELVKIEPKSIGVGQYQHDVHQALLQRKLDEVVESCVNHVGVELNTASVPLLARVAGIGPALAKRIVQRREQGPYAARAQLLDVPGMGPRTFEQAAGFLRIRQGTNPLDNSAVHPERYDVVQRMATDLAVDLRALVGNEQLAQQIDVKRYVTDDVGEPTLRDIIAELQKPGRDPRAQFEPPAFRDDVFELSHLEPDMVFEGVVTNVTAFGAFVDIGVHQDGLVHISQLADRFVKDPNAVVRVGDKLTVRVLEVDLRRRRIALTARTDGTTQHKSAPHKTEGAATPPPKQQRKRGGAFSNKPFANLHLTSSSRR